MHLEIREEVRTRNMNLAVRSRKIVYKSMKIDEVTQKVSIYKEEKKIVCNWVPRKPTQDPSDFYGMLLRYIFMNNTSEGLKK